MLRGTEACSIVARHNSCLYLWQANRLIKGSHVCFCARYLALSKHCHIYTPQPSQSQHFLPYCGARPWHVEPAVRFFPRELWPSCQWLSKNACLIEKFSWGLSWWNAEMQRAHCCEYCACVIYIMYVIILPDITSCGMSQERPLCLLCRRRDKGVIIWSAHS